MSTYILLNAGIILIPLLFSFEKKLKFYRKLPDIAVSIFITGTVYIIWDIYAAGESHWSFNPDYVSDIKIYGLPLGEILFFITVPYAMLFLYETFLFYFGSRFSSKLNLSKYSVLLSLPFIGAAIIFSGQPYTFIVLLACAVFFIISSYYSSQINSMHYWIFITFSFLPFIIVNYILTALPVVLYDPAAIWGHRFISIPLEDFFYSFSLISFYILVFKSSESLRLKKR
jgi:lycopene cyclase domain-containing protein